MALNDIQIHNSPTEQKFDNPRRITLNAATTSQDLWAAFAPTDPDKRRVERFFRDAVTLCANDTPAQRIERALRKLGYTIAPGVVSGQTLPNVIQKAGA